MVKTKMFIFLYRFVCFDRKNEFPFRTLLVESMTNVIPSFEFHLQNPVDLIGAKVVHKVIQNFIHSVLHTRTRTLHVVSKFYLVGIVLKSQFNYLRHKNDDGLSK